MLPVCMVPEVDALGRWVTLGPVRYQSTPRTGAASRA
ncbi:MAG: hypothetical protein QOI06_2371 [Nocardioidaceae bacterium]|jgi:hypothetical protein|nr:hypothetical protein [Nocardioidaceae bacterium]